MRWNWMGRGAGAVCAVAGCMPMLAALVGGAAGSATSNLMMGSSMMAAASPPREPAWVVGLGQFSWPLLIVSAALLIWSFRRTGPLPRGLAYASVALLVVNRLAMTPWIFFPAMGVLAIAFVVAYMAARQTVRTTAESVAPILD
jgi:hypothetical protein